MAKTLMTIQLDDLQVTPLAVMQLARRTDDRFLDISESGRDDAIRCLQDMDTSLGLNSLISGWRPYRCGNTGGGFRQITVLRII